jgi:DNA recombination protein RmuC
MSVEIFLLISLFAGLAALAGVFFWLHLKSKMETTGQMQELAKQIIDAQQKDQSMQLLQQQIGTLRDQLSKSLTDSAKIMADSQKTVGDRLDRAAEVVGNVQKALGALDGATKQVFEVGKDIAQLQEILRAPKVRGTFGELFLGDLLAQILPPKHFSLQHAFRSGEIVDAVVRIGRLVSVDAKFPLENFKRLIQTQASPQEKTLARRKFIQDVKKHIDAISSKYILPDEGTFDFALMYIPAENVYYEMIIKDDGFIDETSIMTYAFSKRVVPVSPNSFYAYLHTISLGLRGLQIEDNARLIIEQLARLRGDFGRFKEDFSLLGKHLSNSRTKFEDAERRLDRFGDKLALTGGADEAPSVESVEKSLLS